MGFTIRPARSTAVLAFALLCMACGGGGSNSSSETGQFVDSNVEGVRYVGDTYSGVTNALGQYQYVPGDQVCFFLGLIPLGCGEATGVFTPIDLFEGADSDDCRVLNVVRFMLSLDADGDPDNGIDLTGIETSIADAENIDFDQDCDAFGADGDVLAFIDEWGYDGDLVSEEMASSHFEASLEESDYFEQALLGSWMYTAYGEVVEDARILHIDDQALDAMAANVEENGEVEFELAGDGPGEVCEHLGGFEDDDLIYGELSCESARALAALVVEPLGSVFYMDRLDPTVDYATSDLLGVWYFMNSLSEAGGPIEIGEEDLTEISADVSPSGAVSFEIVDDLGEGEETCQYSGQMNAFKYFVSGSVSCTLSGDGFFDMEMEE